MVAAREPPGLLAGKKGPQGAPAQNKSAHEGPQRVHGQAVAVEALSGGPNGPRHLDSAGDPVRVHGWPASSRDQGAHLSGQAAVLQQESANATEQEGRLRGGPKGPSYRGCRAACPADAVDGREQVPLIAESTGWWGVLELQCRSRKGGSGCRPDHPGRQIL